MGSADSNLDALLGTFGRKRDETPSGDGDVGAALARLRPPLRRYLSPNLAARFDAGPDQVSAADLYDAVQHLSRLYRIISSFLPSHLVQERTLEQQEGHLDPAELRPRGRFLTGSLLFADVTGFTAMSERLAGLGQEGAERLTGVMNRYFEVMLEQLGKSGGVLLKFAGDAVLAFFPRHDSQGNVAPDTLWAIRAGLRMQRAMAQFARLEVAGEVFTLGMGVGINSGTFLAASVGTHRRREYVITGHTVHDVMAIEAAARSGQVVVGPSTRRLIGDRFRLQGDGPYVVTDDLGDELGDYEMGTPVWRPARLGAVLDRSAPALVRQLERSLPLVESLAPYLAPDLLDRLVAHPEQRAVESEYRPATVIFANFDGLSEMLEALGRGDDSATQVTEVLNLYFLAMQDVVARYGGIISRIDPYGQGSKLLALFGAPVKHEDDPLRAVGAALEMQEAMQRFAALRTRQGTFGLRQRIGITYGLTFAGRAGTLNRQEYTVMGDDVNLAARLMGAAAMGQILISGRVHGAVAPFVEAAELAPIRVKGKSQPVPSWRVIARKTRREQPTTQGPLIGRQAELEVGQAAIEAALAGQGQFVAIGGETGIGKSRLAAELAARGRARGMDVLRGDCLPHGQDTPYLPWAELLNEYFELDTEEALWTEPEDGPLFREARPAARVLRRTARVETGLRALGLAGGGRAAVLSDLMGLTMPTIASGLPAAQPTSPAEGLFGRLQQRVAGRGETRVNLWQLAGERLRTRWMPQVYALIADLVRRRVDEQPLVLLFEDVHWIDGPSLELLNFVAESIADWPVLLVVTHRPDARLGHWAAYPHFHPINLSGLSRADSLALAASLLGVPTLPEALGQLLFDRSQGNPLFIRELAQGLRESEAVEVEVDETGGEVRLRGDVASLRVPATVGEVILSRVDRLPAGERDLLRAAAVAGQTFRPELLRRLVPTVDLEGPLRRLTEAGLLVAAGGGLYAFQHSLVREVAYDSLSLARRRRLHRAVGDYYEAEFRGEALVEHYELLAHHARLSGQEKKAARYALLAGHKARGRAAYRPAIGYYRQGVEAMESGAWPDVGDDERRSAYEGLGDVCALAGEYPAAAEAYRQAVALAGDVAGLHGKLGLLCPLAGDDEGALAELRLAWDGLGEGEAGRRQAVSAALGWLLWARGETGEAARWCQRGLAVEGGPLAALLHWVGGVVAESRDDEAEAHYRQAVAGWQAAGEPRGLALACGRLADLYSHQGRDQLAAEYRQQATDSRATAPSAADVPDHRRVYRQVFHLAVELFL